MRTLIGRDPPTAGEDLDRLGYPAILPRVQFPSHQIADFVELGGGRTFDGGLHAPGGLKRLKDEHRFLLTRERVVSIVGMDEVDLERNHVSWVSPLGRALMKSAEGDEVVVDVPGGPVRLTVLDVWYERIEVVPFREPPGAESTGKGLAPRNLHQVEGSAPAFGPGCDQPAGQSLHGRVPGAPLPLGRRIKLSASVPHPGQVPSSAWTRN